ncbi:MAG: SDR family oxidoreductase [Martelella sp.]
MARRIALIGGAGGIGRVLARELAAAGDAVIVLDLAASLERHGVEGIAVDLKSEASIEEAFADLAKCGPLAGFVNLAGYNAELIPLAETPTDYFDDIIAGNLRGAFLAARAAIPLLVGPDAAMVMVASGLAQHVRPGYTGYAASKAALIAMTKTLALECAPAIRINAVAPGLVDTAFVRGGTGRSDESAASVVDFAAYSAMTPLGRVATPEDVTGPIRFLLGPDSGFMTGQVLWINGGGYMP